MAQMPHATPSPAEGAEPLFVCDVLDADAQYSGWLVDTGEPKKTRSGRIRTLVRFGIILYVRLVAGALPSPVLEVDGVQVNGVPARYMSGTARFAPGAFAPTPAQVITASGHVYAATLLGSFPALSEQPSALRALFHPPSQAGPEVRPVIVESMGSLIDGFRPRNAQLIALKRPVPEPDLAQEPPIHGTHCKRQARRQREQAAQESREQLLHYEREKMRRALATRRLIEELGPDAALDPLLAALTDELSAVREAAAHALSTIAQRLPVAPFLSAIEDRSWLNAAVCEVAAHVFLAHVDEVPVDVLMDLYTDGDAPWYTDVHVLAIQAMARLGKRAPDEVVALLADIAAHKPHLTDIRVRWSVATALGDLGARAPVDALIAGMRDLQPEVASAAARSLLRHPGPVADEALQEARLLSDLESARRIIYGRVRERLNVLPPPDEPSSTPDG